MKSTLFGSLAASGSSGRSYPQEPYPDTHLCEDSIPFVCFPQYSVHPSTLIDRCWRDYLVISAVMRKIARARNELVPLRPSFLSEPRIPILTGLRRTAYPAAGWC